MMTKAEKKKHNKIGSSLRVPSVLLYIRVSAWAVASCMSRTAMAMSLTVWMFMWMRHTEKVKAISL